MMMMNVSGSAIATSCDLQRLANYAIKAANSHDFDGCFDVLRYMKQRLNLSVKDLRDSASLLPLSSLRNHENPKIRMEANLLFNSWMKTLYSPSTCNKRRRSRDEEEETGGEINQIDDDRNRKRRRLVKLSEIPKDLKSVRDKPDDTVLVANKTNDDQRCTRPLKSGEIKHKPEEERKSINNAASRSLPMKHKPSVSKSVLQTLQTKKKKEAPLKESQNLKNNGPVFNRKKNSTETNPRSKAHETGKIKHKPGVCKSVLPTTTTTTTLPMQTPLKDCQNLKNNKGPALKKNSKDVLDLFQIAKKTADVANAKGILAAKAEASICVDTLTLLMEFPISSTDAETKRIMVRLLGLTKHKDRKICHSASALLQCWKQNLLTCV